MTHINRLFLVVLIVAAAAFVWTQRQEPIPTPATEDTTEQEQEQETVSTTYSSLKGVELILTNPTLNSTITSPLTVMGEAPGYWFFEASFPLVLVNWDGLIIAQGYATAQEDPDAAGEVNWMTEEDVPFEGTLEFEAPQGDQEFFRRGALILQRDNPSGLPENDDAVEIPIRFKE